MYSSADVFIDIMSMTCDDMTHHDQWRLHDLSDFESLQQASACRRTYKSPSVAYSWKGTLHVGQLTFGDTVYVMDSTSICTAAQALRPFILCCSIHNACASDRCPSTAELLAHGDGQR